MTAARDAHLSREATFTVPLAAGQVEIRLRDGYQGGSWTYRLAEPALLTIDYLDPWLCRVDGHAPLQRSVPVGFVPSPRLRLTLNGVVHEFVSTNEAVLQRHYSRASHQEVAYAPRPDRFLDAYHHARLRQCRRLLRGVTGRVCDVGSGYSLVRMAGPWAFELSAFDRDAQAVDHLVTQGVRAVVAPADEPPFASGSFDAVYAGEIVEHIVDPELAIHRWVQLLRPGGLLIVTTPNRRHLLTRVRGFELVENPEHLFEWDAREFARAVSRAGGAITAIEGLLLPLPVWIPGRGWRDLAAGCLRRVPVPRRIAVAVLELGRPFPRLAADIAIVARRPSDLST